MPEELNILYTKFADDLHLSVEILDHYIKAGLNEDIGSGDLTVQSIVTPEAKGTARIFTKCDGVIAGILLAWRVFYTLDNDIEVQSYVTDGTRVKKGDEVLSLRGNAGAMLSAERTALNFLGKLSGIATLAQKFLNEVEGLKIKICDTRKTTPGWRKIEKYAVRTGGMTNHRMNLSDQVLIKENHLRVSGNNLADAVKMAVSENPGVIIGAEAENLDEMKHAINAGASFVLIDEFSIDEMVEAVKIRDEIRKKTNRIVELEASGGVTLENIRKIAETGVNRISLGAVTHSAKVLDLSCLFDRI